MVDANHYSPRLQWQNGRRGQDGWGRWTRRRKWYRDAELVEAGGPENAPKKTGSNGLNDALPYTPTPPPMIPNHPELLPSPSISSATVSAPALVANVEEGKEGNKELERAKDKDDEDEFDSASILSSSSKSTRFKSPTLRRRITDSSQRGRRTSGAADDEDVASSLGTSLNLAIQDAAREGENLAFGDEMRMGLE